MQPDHADTIVLGAGIAGCALAYHLALHGTHPIVVDPRTPAAGASGRAAGVLTEQLWNEWDVRVVRESHREYAELCRRWDPAAYRRNGFLRWTRRGPAREALLAAHARLRRWGAEVRVLEAEGLSKRLPEGAFGEGAVGLDSPHDGCVDPTALTGIYAEAARREGVRFELGTAVGAISLAQGRWDVQTATGRFRAQRLVLAAGAWTKRIAIEVGHPLPLSPYRTQAALLRPARPARADLPTGHDLDSDVYLRPEGNGRILAGDGTELVEADPDRFVAAGDPAFLVHLAEALGSSWPGLADSEVLSAWAGVCTSTPDRRPLIGPVPGASELFVIAGFNGFGVMRGGGAARRLAALLEPEEGGESGVSLLEPVDPARFRPPYPTFAPRSGFTLEGGDDPRF